VKKKAAPSAKPVATDVKARNAKPAEKPYKVFFENGLYLLINPNGSKYWRLRYYVNGKEKTVALGVYAAPADAQRGRVTKGLTSLADARRDRDNMLTLLQGGDDPASERKATKEAMRTTFEDVACMWWNQWSKGSTERHAKVVLDRLKNHAFKEIGHVPVKKLDAAAFVGMAKKVDRNGTPEMARRVLQTCGQIMRHAVAHSLAQRNPVIEVAPSDFLASRKVQNLARLDAKELPELLRKINNYDGSVTTKCALRLMALTFVRTSELIDTRWEEIDEKANLWRIPAERMKMKTPHLVPLSKQALVVLNELRQETGKWDLLFASGQNPRKPVNKSTILSALYRMGYKGKMTGHGFRGVASTILHENGFPHEHIEIQLAHQERNQVSAAYNHATYVKQRAEMMQWWGDYLTRAAALTLVIPMKKGAV
jgi:integrase